MASLVRSDPVEKTIALVCFFFFFLINWKKEISLEKIIEKRGRKEIREKRRQKKKYHETENLVRSNDVSRAPLIIGMLLKLTCVVSLPLPLLLFFFRFSVSGKG